MGWLAHVDFGRIKFAFLFFFFFFFFFFFWPRLGTLVPNRRCRVKNKKKKMDGESRVETAIDQMRRGVATLEPGALLTNQRLGDDGARLMPVRLATTARP
jgi:hypothetical protein